MIDWATVFDEIHPSDGASVDTIAKFVASVGLSLSVSERRAVAQRQRNPFPVGDPLYSAFRPIDPSVWRVPNRPLPETYLALLKWSDGGEFRSGERWFGFFPALDPGHGVRAMMLANELPEYMPGALPIGFNGGGTFYLLDMRKPAEQGEYPVVCAHSGNLGWRADQCVHIADTFLSSCRGTTNVEDLR